ncbi:MAG: biotin/lipoyl-containing protein [Bacteroidota bacterium]
MKQKYHVTVDNQEHEVSTDDAGNHTVNGKPVVVDAVQMTEGVFSVIFEGTVYEVSRQQGDHGTDQNGDTRGMTLLVNGTPHQVKVDDERSLLLKSVLEKPHSAKSTISVRAPMPGLITKIEVHEGDTITEGQGLVILEAMKMENEIKSASKAIVGSIHVKLRQTVDKGEVLVTLSSI